MRASLLLLLFALPAAAADPFEGLKRLDRVTVTDKDGDTVRGIVRSILRGRMSLQIEGREGLTGSLVFERKSVRKIEKTGIATEEELKAASEPEAPPPEGLVEPERVASKVEAPPAPPRPVLEAFPTTTWSSSRHDEIALKDAYLRSADEREFLARIGEWTAAVAALNREMRLALIRRFPPGELWNQATFDRLRVLMAVIGRELTAEEKDFVSHFEAWRTAMEETAR
ncbi:MAG: hypothetical protein AAB074_01590 [Planctomycetota bacterium]